MTQDSLTGEHRGPLTVADIRRARMKLLEMEEKPELVLPPVGQYRGPGWNGLGVRWMCWDHRSKTLVQGGFVIGELERWRQWVTGVCYDARPYRERKREWRRRLRGRG